MALHIRNVCTVHIVLCMCLSFVMNAREKLNSHKNKIIRNELQNVNLKNASLKKLFYFYVFKPIDAVLLFEFMILQWCNGSI